MNKKFEGCIVEGCEKKHRSLGYCDMHYTRVRRHGDPGSAEVQRNDNIVSKECQIDDCFNKHNAYGYCQTHYLTIYRYGITPEEVEKKIQEQNGLCKICQNPLDRSRPKAVHIDHCHITDIVRGILCASCNLALGSFHDSIPLLERTIDYIMKYGDI